MPSEPHRAACADENLPDYPHDRARGATIPAVVRPDNLPLGASDQPDALRFDLIGLAPRCLRLGGTIWILTNSTRTSIAFSSAVTSGQSVIAGMGGEISDDLDANRDEIERVRYPRWKAEYRLKILDEHVEHERMLVFATPPAHKGRGTPGSEAVAELINTHRPRLVLCGGPRRSETLGRSTVVAPGDLADGHYALADIRSRDVELCELVAA